MSDPTQIKDALEQADRQPPDELRRLSAHELGGERPGQTLETTALE